MSELKYLELHGDRCHLPDVGADETPPGVALIQIAGVPPREVRPPVSAEVDAI
ncbi:MAG: hypothetical protein ACLPXZ_18905 [Mycobacterium sp.]